ncbi:MAG: amidase [Anaerolineaceae bacterium]|nr:amidase [Betaproteobacteria bacterium]
MSQSIFLEKSIPEIVQLLKTHELSTNDLIRVCERVVQENEDKIKAWVRFNPNEKIYGLASPDIAPLYGIPFGIKDIFNTSAFPTQMGSPIWEGFTPGNNARIVDSLIWAGAIPVGKTVTAEFAVHALNETRNPHDPTRTPGTSSSGSAAAVACGMVPFALGSQTAGSIVRPASFCGVWGMKPTFGMLPRTGVLKTTDSLDTLGFLAAHATSLRKILDVTRVTGPNYPFVYKNVDSAGSYPKSKNRTWRVGFVKTHIWHNAEDYAQKAILDLVGKISRTDNFEVEEIIWPNSLHEAHRVHSVIYTKSLAYYFKNEAAHSSKISPVMLKMMQEGEGISIDEYHSALRQQEYMIDEIDRIFSDYDFVVSLGTGSSAPLRGVEELPDPSLIWTLGHVPSVAAPLFRCPDGLPFGAQFVARRWSDYKLLQGIEELVAAGILPVGSQIIKV